MHQEGRNTSLVLRAIPQITVAMQSWDAQNKHNCGKLFCDLDEKYGAGNFVSDTRRKSTTYVTLGKFRYMDEKPDTRRKMFDTRRRNNTSYVEWGKFRYMDDTRMKNTSYVTLGKVFLLLCHDDDLWLESPWWPNITRKQCLIGICQTVAKLDANSRMKFHLRWSSHLRIPSGWIITLDHQLAGKKLWVWLTISGYKSVKQLLLYRSKPTKCEVQRFHVKQKRPTLLLSACRYVTPCTYIHDM